eukprot:12538802-Alexandrium_andersonii.AAC.1
MPRGVHRPRMMPKRQNTTEPVPEVAWLKMNWRSHSRNLRASSDGPSRKPALKALAQDEP